MIIFISDKQVQKNFKKAGFKTVGEGVTELVNKAAFNYIKKQIEKALKKNKNSHTLEAVHFAKQSGGRVLMPSEYFGVSSNHYVEITDKTQNGTDMAVKDTWIRPAFTAELNGGAPKFVVSMQSVKNIVAEILNTKKTEVSIKPQALKVLHSNVIAKLSDVTKSLERKVKSDSLEKKDIVSVLSMTKFKSLS